MGRVIHREVEDLVELAELLGVNSPDRYLAEFERLPTVCRDATEDWGTEPELLAVFYAYLRQNSPRTVVEVGTFKGTSACVLSAAIERNGHGHLYTIDNDACGSLHVARQRLSEAGLARNVTVIEKSSESAFSDWGRAAIDFLYIDGSHEFAHACLDFSLWARYVTKTGLIAMHDTVTRLLRRFPEDYLFPLGYFDVLNITGMKRRPSRHEWEGCGFIRVASPL